MGASFCANRIGAALVASATPRTRIYHVHPKHPGLRTAAERSIYGVSRRAKHLNAATRVTFLEDSRINACKRLWLQIVLAVNPVGGTYLARKTLEKETQVLHSMGRQVDRFRVPVAVIVATSMAMAVWAPASAAGRASFKAPLLSRAAHGVQPSSVVRQALLSNSVQPHSIHRDTNPTTVSLYSSTLSIKTSTGLTRKENISANRTFGSSAEVGLSLDRHGSSLCGRTPCQDNETVWAFSNLPASDFAVTTSTGNGSVTLSSASSGPFAGFHFVFTHTTTTKETCNVSGSEYIYTGVLSGTQDFHTKITSTVSPLEPSILGDINGPSGAGGTVTFPNTSSTNTTYLVVNNDCQNKSGPPPPAGKTLCQRSTFWSTPLVHNASFSVAYQDDGETGTTYSYPTSSFNNLYASRYVSFSGLPATGGFGGASPAEVTRGDYGSDNLPTMSYSFSTTSPHPQTVTTTVPSGDAYFKGSASLTSTKSTNSFAYTCYVQTGPTTYIAHNEYARYDTSGTATYSWANGSTPLEFLADVGGLLLVGNKTSDTSASIDRDTYI